MEANDKDSDVGTNDQATPNRAEISPELVLHLTNAQARIYGFLLKRLANRDQALEVLQNVNLTICRKADDFVPDTDFIAWAFTIARFQLLAYRQARARDRLVFSPELEEAINLLDESQLAETTLTDRKSALDNCLHQLTKEHYELVLKRYAESCSVKAIAADLGKTANAVSLLLHRIREQLLDCINLRLAQRSND